MEPTTDTAQPNAEPTQPTSSITDRPAGATPNAASDGFTPEQQAKIDAIVANEKVQVRLGIQKQYGDLEALKTAKEQLDAKNAAELSEMERMQKTIDDMKTEQVRLTQEAETTRINALRVRVGHELGLPPVLAERLTGADEDAIKADAAVMLAAVKLDPRIPNIDATAGGTNNTTRKPLPKLTPGEMATAEEHVRSGLFKSVEEYAELQAQIKD